MSGTAYILSNNSLIRFDTSNPDNPNPAIPVTGLGAGESLVGIDVRPQNGRLYGLTSSAAGVRLYVISPQTGVATALTPAPVQFDDGTNPVPIQGTSFGFDFNPTVDRIRVVTSGGQNFRLNPNTGTIVDGNNGGAAVVPGTNPDGPINGGSTTVDGTAYTNNAPNVSATTQYTLDAVSNSLLIQNPPNSGTQTLSRPITLNGSPLDFTNVNGFDIPAGVNVTTSNTPATGQALAALTVNGTAGLYSIELSTGAATLVGSFGSGVSAVQGFATQSEPVANGVPLIGLSGSNLLRFNSASPATATPVAITGVPTGETLVGVDFRPATGQLYGFSVNAATNTGTVLLIDPQTGAATAVGTPGQVAFVDGAGNPVDLPADGYGIDFNPTVDRLRIVTSSGLNFRLNPATGAPVDGDNGALAVGSVTGINPDGTIKGAATSVDATAYTNSFSQVTGATVTTQYTLDAASNSLLIQNPPNSGTQTSRLAVTLNGAALDFDSANGFDILPAIQAPASNAAASGRGFAALQVGGTTSLYAIELSTGAATRLGPIGTGASLIGLTAAEAPTGSIAFGAATYNASETGATVAINLVRTNGSAGAATVNLAATGGTATASDYSGLPASVTFADGQTTATVNLAITQDTTTEGSETVTFSLSNPTNAVLAAQDTTTLTITDTAAGTAPILGTGGADNLRGTAGDDTILALGGNDRLLGLAGSDNLVGGRGADRSTGGAGADRFIYKGRTQRAALVQSLIATPDQITDFNSTQGDRIQLSFDNDLATTDRPTRLYNAGELTGSLTDAVQAAYTDKHQTRRGEQGLLENEAVFFSVRGKTYLAVNDSRAGYAADRDLLVNMNNINLGAGENVGRLAVATYFA